MRPVCDIDPEFFAPDEELTQHLPLLDAWLQHSSAGQPLGGMSALLVQHQLCNQIPMLAALQALGLDPKRTWWLDIPYTSHERIRDYAHRQLQVPADNLRTTPFPVLEHYASWQHARVVKALLTATREAPGPLLVLDDGAYVLEALASLAPARWPSGVAIVEQTTRGFIKYERNASLRRAAEALPIVDVARSDPKRTLEPPFIAMAVCAAIHAHLEKHFGGSFNGNCLVLGYGAIGEQVATFVRHHFKLPRERVYVHDPLSTAAGLAARRGFRLWDQSDFRTRFQLVVGCSGQASFTVGDAVYLEDGALLVSASSGVVEMSRQDFIELADASPSDDIKVLREDLDEFDVHANIRLRLVDRTVTFVNAGFPVNFNGRMTVCPTRYIQPTPTMMVAATLQAARALRAGAHGVQELDRAFCDWVDPAFRDLLGDRASWLLPVPESAW